MGYYIDTLVDKFGFHQIHAGYCKLLPEGLCRLFLGDFESSSSAIRVAKMYFFPKVKECSKCCKDRDKA